MYILDTDHLSLIQRNGLEGKQIISRLLSIEEEVFVTVITYEEQIRGRLSVLARAKSVSEHVIAYSGLRQLALDYQSIMILPFDTAAALEHQRLRKDHPRLGNMDLENCSNYSYPISHPNHA